MLNMLKSAPGRIKLQAYRYNSGSLCIRNEEKEIARRSLQHADDVVATAAAAAAAAVIQYTVSCDDDAKPFVARLDHAACCFASLLTKHSYR